MNYTLCIPHCWPHWPEVDIHYWCLYSQHWLHFSFIVGELRLWMLSYSHCRCGVALPLMKESDYCILTFSPLSLSPFTHIPPPSGAIAGIVIGVTFFVVLVTLAIVFVVFFWYYRTRPVSWRKEGRDSSVNISVPYYMCRSRRREMEQYLLYVPAYSITVCSFTHTVYLPLLTGREISTAERQEEGNIYCV